MMQPVQDTIVGKKTVYTNRKKQKKENELVEPSAKTERADTGSALDVSNFAPGSCYEPNTLAGVCFLQSFFWLFASNNTW